MLLANPDRLAIEAVAAALEPPPVLDLLEWAERNIVFDDGPFKGPYNRQLFPFFDEPLRALSPSDPCRNVTMAASAQVGKTALATIAALGWASTSRGSFMVCPPDRRQRNSLGANETRAADEVDGGCARSFPSTRQRATRVDSVQRTKGRPFSLAGNWRQLPGFVVAGDDRRPDSRRLQQVRSQPDGRPGGHGGWPIAGHCRRENLQNQHAFGFARLPHHAKLSRRIVKSIPMSHARTAANTKSWSGRTSFPTNRTKHISYAHAADRSSKSATDRRCSPSFEWRAHNPDAAKQHRSFLDLVRLLVSSNAGRKSRASGFGLKAIPPAKKRSGMTRWAWPTSPRAKRVRPTNSRRAHLESHYSRGEVPEGALVLTLGIDVQLDRCEWQVIGHGEHYRKFVIDVGTIGKHISEPDAQRNIDLLLQRKWTNFRGRQIGISLAAIDAGWSTDDVLTFAHRYPPTKAHRYPRRARRQHAADSARAARTQRKNRDSFKVFQAFL